MANNQPRRSLFVDFMYAIVVGSAFPALSGDRLDLSNIGFWSIIFLLAIVLEDYYLYETQIVPFQQPGDVPLMALLFEISILVNWYIATAAVSAATASTTPVSTVPTDVTWFLCALGVFYLLKLLAGIAHWTASYKKTFANLKSWKAFLKGIKSALGDWRCLRNLAFVLPLGTALIIVIRCKPTTVDWLTLLLLLVAWIVMIIVWWGITAKKQ